MSTLRQRAPLDLIAVSFGREGLTSAYMTFSLELCPIETVLCLETYNDVAKDYLFGWFVVSFHKHTGISTVLDYSASARERRRTKLSFIDKILLTKNSFKDVQCFYIVKETRVHVGEREMLWEQNQQRYFHSFFQFCQTPTTISMTR